MVDCKLANGLSYSVTTASRCQNNGNQNKTAEYLDSFFQWFFRVGIFLCPFVGNILSSWEWLRNTYEYTFTVSILG